MGSIPQAEWLDDSSTTTARPWHSVAGHEQDHVVEPSNASWILANVSSVDLTEVVLPNSYHVATLDHDAEQIFVGSAAFVKRIIAG